jgi:hypothetical protein
MPNQKISELSAITLIDDADVLPIVDSIAIETKKISVTQIKGLAPVQSVNGSTGSVSVQETLVSGTNIKSINSTTVLGSGDIAVQETLVSGTNIKTINSTSLLGSGDIVIGGGSPSGVSGAIQFSDGSAFASDAANLFWDDTNNRLGVGTNTPAYGLDVSQNIGGDIFARFQNTNSGGFGMSIRAGNGASIYTLQWANYLGSGGGRIYPDGVIIGQQTTPSARLQVKGSGTTSATTSLLVQNSAGTAAITVTDDGIATIPRINSFGYSSSFQRVALNNGTVTINSYLISPSNGVIRITNNAEADFDRLQFGGTSSSFPSLKRATNNLEVKNADDTFGAGFSVGATLNASAILQADSTTRGFLPPRMTTTQKNAISSPASGLMVYDTDTNKLCCYNGTSWNDLF